MTRAQTQEELESCLVATMARLCNGNVPSDVDACRQVHALGFFEMATPFERVKEALGPGTGAEAKIVEDGPGSFGASVEHRYALARWPSFEFVIFESDGGIAWGYRFSRRIGVPTPDVRGLVDLGRWSHVESEVRAAFGEPISHEGWAPWESLVYRLDGRDIILCFVFGLLQDVQTMTEHAITDRKIARTWS